MIKINMLRPKWSGNINGKEIRVMHLVIDRAIDYAPTAENPKHQLSAYLDCIKQTSGPMTQAWDSKR